MPISKYFSGSGSKVLRSMVSRYGPAKGKSVFYATANKRSQTPARSVSAAARTKK